MRAERREHGLDGLRGRTRKRSGRPRTTGSWNRVLSLAISLAWALPYCLAAASSAADEPRRIVSLIPAVTEMLFAIGAGPRVVGVSSFDRYPPEVKSLPKVGALLDPDVERILSLKPDLVIVYGSQTDLRAQLQRATVPVYDYSHAGLGDVTTTMRALGERVGRKEAAEALASGIETRIDAIRRQAAGARPKTLVVFTRDAFALRGIYASGGIGFINDMLTAAGGENVLADLKQQAVQATTELILSRRPEVILELRATPLPPGDRAREEQVWRTLPAVPAVKAGRVYIVADERTVIPGPRVAEAVGVIAALLHPQK